MVLKKRHYISFVVLLAIIMVGFALFHASSSASSSTNSRTSDTTSTTAKVKLMDTAYAPYAFLISGETLDNPAKRATAGFSIKRVVNADGSLTLTLHALTSEYHDQELLVPQGDSAYFIETSMGDDSIPDGEYNLGDDSAVLVDQEGYIIQ